MVEDELKPMTKVYDAPAKPALYKHIATVEQANAEAAELIGKLRDFLGDELVAEISAGDAGRVSELSAYWQIMQRALAYLRMAIPPAEWDPYLPAIRLDDPKEAQQ
jgi:hypothetical protein